jgi:hypothetical protein
LEDCAALRYPKDDDFLADLLPAIKSMFFPDEEFRSLVFLLSLLTNQLPWFKIKTMHLLCVIIPDVDMKKREIASQGSDLISPLLRLLQTEFCPQALAVLDNVMMTMTATPLDNKHLRMSMAGANTSRALRKEYENVKSLYGIPEESGWSVPMPAIHALMTRANVHAVFYTCAGPEVAVAPEEAASNIELVAEEYSETYYPDYRTATMMSDDTRHDNQPGDLVMKLESLDDFFDEDDTDDMATELPHPGLSNYANTTDVRESLYDQQTYPILNKSLKRNASVSSFNTGFADLRISPSREAMIMTPTLFASELRSPFTQTTLRPGMHTRSITSPAGSQISPPGNSFSLEETLVDEPFSEDDYDADPSVRLAGNDKLFSLRTGFRSGIRRLTGGGGDALHGAKTREAIRTQLQRSPRVPKVPDVYLQNPKSSDL